MVNSSSSLAISCATSPKTRGFVKSYKKIRDIPWYNQIGRMTLRLAILVLCIVVVLCAPPNSKGGPDTFARFDEFGALNHCDLLARLDNFAIVLLKIPDSTGYVVSYGPDVEGPGSRRSMLHLMKDYLVKTRGLPGRRIKTIYAGRNEV